MTATNSVNTYITATANNEVTMPSQPAFLAYKSGVTANVTGNGAVYTIIFDTEVFDQNADYNNATGVFTAPVTGRYLFCASALLNPGIVNATTFVISIVTSNRTYTDTYARPAFPASGMSSQKTCIADMDAADTVYVTIQSTGEAGDVNDLNGGATSSTFFSGMLVV